MPPAFAEVPLEKICIENTCLKVEIASSLQERRLGLMFRESLAQDRGMLFVLDPQEGSSFWMKNMRFPLDIIWISKDKVITEIMQNVPQCVESCPDLMPQQKACFVLEVNAGFVKKHRIKTGDKVGF